MPSPLQQIIELAKQLDHLELRSIASALMQLAYQRERETESVIKDILNT